MNALFSHSTEAGVSTELLSYIYYIRTWYCYVRCESSLSNDYMNKNNCSRGYRRLREDTKSVTKLKNPKIAAIVSKVALIKNCYF